VPGEQLLPSWTAWKGLVLSSNHDHDPRRRTHKDLVLVGCFVTQISMCMRDLSLSDTCMEIRRFLSIMFHDPPCLLP
jgi:hypothetical protein